MPVILGPDGPSLGGFVCPVTVIEAELWKLGQLKAGDRCASCRSICASARALAAARRQRDRAARQRTAPACTETRVARLAGGASSTGEGDTRRWWSRPSGDTLPAARDRPAGARPGAALSRPRADAGCMRGASGFAGHRRPHARHPLAAGALRPGNAAAGRAARRCIGALRTDVCAARRPRGALAHRAPAAVLGRPGQPAGDREVHDSRCARTRPGARATSSSSAASTGCDEHRRRCCDIVFDAQLPGAGPGRRLPRRAGGHAAGPAPPAGHHQVQPGAHLDAGERGRHRRRLPVRLRHGRPRRLPVRRPHAADVEPLPRRPRRSTASPGCCASSTRSASTRSSADELLRIRARLPARPLPAAHRGQPCFSLADYQRLPGATRPSRIARLHASASRPRFDAERERWIATGQAHFEEGEVAPDVGEDEAAGRTASTRSTATSPATCGRCCVVPGQTVQRRRDAGDTRVDEDGDPAAPRRATAS